MDPKEEYRKWGDSAYYWDLYRKKIEQIYAPITKAILDRAQIESHHKVLDVGGGAGEPSLTLKARTGAQLVFTDPTLEMTSFTRSEAKNRKLQGMQFCACSGDHLPFLSSLFDRIVARLSIMFVPDVHRAAQEMLRVTRTPARVTMAVWDDQQLNPMHFVPASALKPFVPPDPPLPEDAPGAFRFSEPGKLATVFRTAGFSTVEEEIVPFEISQLGSIEEFWKIRSQMSESLRDKLAKLPEEQRVQAVEAAKAAVQPYCKQGTMSFPASVRVITAIA